MKKIFFCVVVLCFLIMSGCSMKGTRLSVEPFSAEVEITDKDVSLKGRLTYIGDGNITFEINEPEEVRDVKLDVYADKSSIVFADLELDYCFDGVLNKLSRCLDSLENAAEESLYLTSEEFICDGYTFVFCENNMAVSAVYKDNFRCLFVY